MGLKPVDERVLIEPMEEQERKVGGIIIPDTVKERPQMGTVVALGDDVPKKEGGKKLSEVISVGDKVIYAKYGGTEIKHGDKEYLIVSRNDILAVVKE
ncbi:MAG: co-chaperone GroES [Candidatus Zixiibacteriota bacterium]|nr:MAG: co-chaperone GroES [candidate division Zixibacteria bacterium]